jgi:NTE family protein
VNGEIDHEWIKAQQTKASLYLSGGGFRATLFHIGALKRMNELSLLQKIDTVVSVSGGSIVAGILGLRWSHLEFRDGSAVNMDTEIVAPLRRFCSRTIDIFAVLRGVDRPWQLIGPGRLLVQSYSKHLYGGARLSDLPDRPSFIFASTDLVEGVPFHFSKESVGDYCVGYVKRSQLTIAECVAASSAFPPFFSPLRLSIGADKFVGGQRQMDPTEHQSRAIYLSDAGVIDNLSIQTAWKQSKLIFVSDAGAPFRRKKKTWFRTSWLGLVFRAMHIAIDQAAPVRRRRIIDDLTSGARAGSYWNTRMRPVTDVAGGFPWSKQKAEQLAGMRTRLDAFNEREQCELINFGYAVSDNYLRHTFCPDAEPPRSLPYPSYPLA